MMLPQERASSGCLCSRSMVMRHLRPFVRAFNCELSTRYSVGASGRNLLENKSSFRRLASNSLCCFSRCSCNCFFWSSIALVLSAGALLRCWGRPPLVLVVTGVAAVTVATVGGVRGDGTVAGTGACCCSTAGSNVGVSSSLPEEESSGLVSSGEAVSGEDTAMGSGGDPRTSLTSSTGARSDSSSSSSLSSSSASCAVSLGC
mmetsp:Transcript_97018/g.202731  ORF Transcript_97018/g.202731 Transcript_97018/m.202731 type:complete len:203 (-) Transcript_97018:209-817(-)